MKLIMEGWRSFLQEDADEELKRKRAAELARLKSYAGESPLKILQMQDDGSAEYATIKDLLIRAEKQKEEALKNLQAQEKAYAAEKEAYAKEYDERKKERIAMYAKEYDERAEERIAMMDKFKAQVQQVAQQSNSPAAAAIAAAQNAEIEKLKQKSAQIEKEFNKRMDSIAGNAGAEKTKEPNFIEDREGNIVPNTREGEDIVLKDPERASSYLKGLQKMGARFSGVSGRPVKDLIAIAKQN